MDINRDTILHWMKHNQVSANRLKKEVEELNVEILLKMDQIEEFEFWVKRCQDALLILDERDKIVGNLNEGIKENKMDKKIKKMEKDTKHVGKELKNYEKDDKKRDKFVKAGKKAMKSGKC